MAQMNRRSFLSSTLAGIAGAVVACAVPVGGLVAPPRAHLIFVTNELIEDCVIDVKAFISQSLRKAMADDFERRVLFGDWR